MPRSLPRQKGMVKAMKLKSVFLAAAACACMIIAPAAHAEEDVITVLVDNEQVTFDQNPVIMNDRTLVPIRAVFEQAGATVGWDQENLTATITKDDYEVIITFGSGIMYKNGEEVELDVPAAIINDRMLIPVRAISEAMDFSVTWDGFHSMVLISTDGKPYRAYSSRKQGFKTLADAAEVYTAENKTIDGVDLDNDGKADVIEFNKTDDMSNITVPALKINGVDYTANIGDLLNVSSIAVVDLDNSDDLKEIVITENENVSTAYFYRYSNGILTQLQYNNTPSSISYASNMFVSGTGWLLSDLTGVSFTDIMVSPAIYKYETDSVKMYTIKIDGIYDRNLYKTYDDMMLYHIIYTDNYTPGSYISAIPDSGVIDTSSITHFKLLNGYYNENDPREVELYVEFPDGKKAVLIPYRV